MIVSSTLQDRNLDDFSLHYPGHSRRFLAKVYPFGYCKFGVYLGSPSLLAKQECLGQGRDSCLW
jgi:hypothetical protein